jgi:hypothetical protein
MHLKVFLKLKKPKKLPFLGKYIKETKKNKKNPKTPKKTQKTYWAGFFFFTRVFPNPASYKLYTCIQYTYSHREGGRGEGEMNKRG